MKEVIKMYNGINNEKCLKYEIDIETFYQINKWVYVTCRSDIHRDDYVISYNISYFNKDEIIQLQSIYNCDIYNNLRIDDATLEISLINGIGSPFTFMDTLMFIIYQDIRDLYRNHKNADNIEYLILSLVFIFFEKNCVSLKKYSPLYHQLAMKIKSNFDINYITFAAIIDRLIKK